jgi:hypothetical protein
MMAADRTRRFKARRRCRLTRCEFEPMAAPHRNAHPLCTKFRLPTPAEDVAAQLTDLIAAHRPGTASRRPGLLM